MTIAAAVTSSTEALRRSQEARLARQAQREQEAALEKELATIRTRRKLSRKPETLARLDAEYAAKTAELHGLWEQAKELVRNDLRRLSDESLMARHASAANYSNEATMGDYSIGSINRAADDLANVKHVLTERGIDITRTLVHLDGFGWRAAAEVPYLTADQQTIVAATQTLGDSFTVGTAVDGNRGITVQGGQVTMSAEAFEALLAKVSA